MNGERIEVWHDTDSDPEAPLWCVSLCVEDGEEIKCLDAVEDREGAVSIAKREAARRGLACMEMLSSGETRDLPIN